MLFIRRAWINIFVYYNIDRLASSTIRPDAQRKWIFRLWIDSTARFSVATKRNIIPNFESVNTALRIFFSFFSCSIGKWHFLSITHALNIPIGIKMHLRHRLIDHNHFPSNKGPPEARGITALLSPDWELFAYKSYFFLLVSFWQQCLVSCVIVKLVQFGL